jgi:hypothetical protein
VGVLRLQVDAKRSDGPPQTASFEPGHHVVNGLGWVVQRVGLALQCGSDESWSELHEMNNEFVSALRFDSIVVKTVGREVAQIVGDDDLRATTDRGGKHMSIVDVGEFERVNEVFVASDKTIGHAVTHQLSGASQFGGKLRLRSGDGALHLVEYLIGPPPTKKPGLSEPDQQVALRSRIKNVGVKQRSEGHVPFRYV